MATTKEQMQRAAQLIKAKRYDEARAILVKINHPTAKEWLARLDKIAPATTKRGRRRMLMPVAGIALLALILVVVAFLLLSGSDEEAAPLPTTVADAASEGDAAPTGTSASTPTDTESDSDSSETGDDATPSGILERGQATLEPGRIQIKDAFSERFISVILPEGWQQTDSSEDIFGNTVNRDTFADSATALVAAPSSLRFISSLQEIAETLLAEGDTAEYETRQSNGREVLIADVTAADTGERTVTFYVRDSDDNLAILIIQPFVPDPDSLIDDVLQMAGTVEID